MYIIQYSVEDILLKEIQSKLEDLSLAFKVEVQPNLSNPILRNSENIWTERETIFAHLNQTEEELKRWHYCNC